MPNLTPQQAARLLQGLSILRMTNEARQSVESFLNAQLEAGTVDELQAQLQSLPRERQAGIAQIQNSVSAFNRGLVRKAQQALSDIPDEYFETAAQEAGLDDD